MECSRIPSSIAASCRSSPCSSRQAMSFRAPLVVTIPMTIGEWHNGVNTACAIVLLGRVVAQFSESVYGPDMANKTRGGKDTMPVNVCVVCGELAPPTLGKCAKHMLAEIEANDPTAPIVDPAAFKAEVAGSCAYVTVTGRDHRADVWAQLLCASVSADVDDESGASAHAAAADALLEEYDKRWTKGGEDSADTEDE